MATDTTETVNGLPLPTRMARRNIVAATLIFCWSLIVWIVLKGSPTNSLHESALSWAFGVSTSVIMLYVFGAIVDNWNLLKATTIVKKE